MVVFFMSWKFLSHFTQIKTNVFGLLIKSAVIYLHIMKMKSILHVPGAGVSAHPI